VNLQIGDVASEMLENIISEDNIQINMQVSGEPELLLAYIDCWRMKLWDHAYVGVFKGADAFKKLDLFRDLKDLLRL